MHLGILPLILPWRWSESAPAKPLGGAGARVRRPSLRAGGLSARPGGILAAVGVVCRLNIITVYTAERESASAMSTRATSS